MIQLNKMPGLKVNLLSSLKVEKFLMLASILIF